MTEQRRATVEQISGHSTSTRLAGPECTSPVGLCTKGEITGTITGTHESVATEITESTVPGVLYVRATTVIQTGDGELHVEEHAIVNSSAEGFGEHTSLGVITGGTGKWTGATGYLHAVGEASDVSEAFDTSRSTISGKVRLAPQE